MSEKVCRMGVVGLGGIAIGRPADPLGTPLRDELRGASHVLALSASPRAELAAVCDVDSERTEEFRRLWADRWPETKFYRSHREMLAKKNLDILAVATPDEGHAEIVVDGA